MLELVQIFLKIIKMLIKITIFSLPFVFLGLVGGCENNTLDISAFALYTLFILIAGIILFFIHILLSEIDHKLKIIIQQRSERIRKMRRKTQKTQSLALQKGIMTHG